MAFCASVKAAPIPTACLIKLPVELPALFVLLIIPFNVVAAFVPARLNALVKWLPTLRPTIVLALTILFKPFAIRLEASFAALEAVLKPFLIGCGIFSPIEAITRWIWPPAVLKGATILVFRPVNLDWIVELNCPIMLPTLETILLVLWLIVFETWFIVEFVTLRTSAIAFL